MNLKITDYLYCNDCKQIIDLWKYDKKKDCFCLNHDSRFLKDKKELKEAIDSCFENGCFQDH